LFHSYAFDFSVWEIWGALLHGGRLVVVPFAVSRDPAAFRALLGREGVTVLNQTPSAFRQLVRADEAADPDADGALPLRWVVFGGEALDPRALRPWFARHGDRGPTLVNMYGITETTVHVTFRPLSAADAGAGAGSMIGEAIPDLGTYLLDARLEPVPAGVPGEVFVGGAGVARGYLGRPALTAERFVPDPFAGVPGARMYRSGDRARRRGGDTEYLGRIDQQVKVRGFRIEPGEIEAALLAHPGVREALVVAREDEAGVRRLAAYVVADVADGEPSPASLRAGLAARLPDYMVPAAFVMLDALPLTPHGKVDHRALPAPYGDGATAASVYVAPRGPVQEALAAVWAQVLGVRQVGAGDHFFELGGDSILSIQVASRARRAGIQITPRQLFEHPTLAGLAAVAGRAGEAPRAEQGRVAGGMPLTPVQAWFFETGHAVPAHHNQSVLLEVDGSVSENALEAALTAVLEHHDALRLRFRRTEAGWEQAHVDQAGIVLERVDLSALPGEERDRAEREAADARQASLDLEHGPLGRAVLCDRGEAGRALFLVLHHLVVDAVSWRIIREDLEQALAQQERGMAIDLGPKSASYRQWAQALEAWAAGGELRDQAGYWLAQGAEGVASLPVDGDGEQTVEASRSVMVRLDADETRALLQEVPAAYHTQVNDVLL
ncbi:MAG: AMP-binding protein, partial [Gemmatimonadetes bacterium]|nr:AMP-binding protein [Gemmatimonadota bacterium]